jgi:tRNA A-37 threonylcarbamoyl transferase component Bud32
MARDALRGEIPDGFKKIRMDHRRTLVVRADMERSVDLSQLENLQSPEASSGLYGRGALALLRLDDGGDALVRRYRHGGALRAVTGDCFFTWPPRPFRELALMHEARRRGVPAVEPLAALVERQGGPFYRGWLVTRRLEGARDMWAVAQAEDFAAGDRASSLEAAARAVRMMHRCGIDHRDLNLKNILLRREAGKARAYIIDFDKSRLFPGEVPRERAAKNLARLERSIRKLDPERRFVSPLDWEYFLKSYREVG